MDIDTDLDLSNVTEFDELLRRVGGIVLTVVTDVALRGGTKQIVMRDAKGRPVLLSIEQHKEQ